MLATLQLAYAVLQSSPSQEAIVASLGNHNTMTLSSLKMLDVTKSRIVNVQGLSEITDVFASADLDRTVIFSGRPYNSQSVHLVFSQARKRIELGNTRLLKAFDVKLVDNKVHILYADEKGTLEFRVFDLTGELISTTRAENNLAIVGTGVFHDNLFAKQEVWSVVEDHLNVVWHERSGLWGWREVLGLSPIGTSLGNYSSNSGIWIVRDQADGMPFRFKIGSTPGKSIRTIVFDAPILGFAIRENSVFAISDHGKVVVFSPQGRILASSKEGFADFLCGQLEGE